MRYRINYDGHTGNPAWDSSVALTASGATATIIGIVEKDANSGHLIVAAMSDVTKFVNNAILEQSSTTVATQDGALEGVGVGVSGVSSKNPPNPVKNTTPSASRFTAQNEPNTLNTLPSVRSIGNISVPTASGWVLTFSDGTQSEI